MFGDIRFSTNPFDASRPYGKCARLAQTYRGL
jgi:hypothetical protein